MHDNKEKKYKYCKDWQTVSSNQKKHLFCEVKNVKSLIFLSSGKNETQCEFSQSMNVTLEWLELVNICYNKRCFFMWEFGTNNQLELHRIQWDRTERGIAYGRESPFEPI